MHAQIAASLAEGVDVACARRHPLRRRPRSRQPPVSATAARLGAVLGVGSRLAWLVILLGISGVAAVVAIGTRQGILPMFLGLVAIALVSGVSLRWPLLPLLIFAALIPIEEVVVIEGFGTISRFAGLLFAVTYGGPRLGRLAFGAMPPAAWAYLAWAALSLGWAIDPDTAWAQLATLLQLFLIAVLVADFVVQRPAIVRPVLWAYSISAAATAVLGIQYYLAQGLADTRAAGIEDQNPAQFAGVLLPALVFGLYEVMNGNRRILGGAITILTAVGVVVSGTRGAWVAGAVVVLLIVLPQLQPRRRIVAMVMMVALAIGAYQIPGVADLVIDRTVTAVSSGGAGRTDIWSVAGTIYMSAPLFGVGYANFPIAYTPDVVRASNVASWAYIEGRGPHNLVVGTLIELGPIGLTLLVLFLGPLILRRGWGPDAATVQAALASLVTLALFLDILSNRKQVWLVVGLAAGLGYIARQARNRDAVGGASPGGPDIELQSGTGRDASGPDIVNSPGPLL
jgi:O-antigen ligase